MQVHCDEGVAIHIDPKSCAGGREAAREASTGARIGQPSCWKRVFDTTCWKRVFDTTCWKRVFDTCWKRVFDTCWKRASSTRAGGACHRRSIALGPQPGQGRRRNSPRSCATSASICSGTVHGAQARCGSRRGRTDVAGLRRGSPTRAGGARPGRGPHDALDALAVAISTRKLNASSMPTSARASMSWRSTPAA